MSFLSKRVTFTDRSANARAAQQPCKPPPKTPTRIADLHPLLVWVAPALSIRRQETTEVYVLKIMLSTLGTRCRLTHREEPS